jgi:hypothetical protein
MPSTTKRRNLTLAMEVVGESIVREDLGRMKHNEYLTPVLLYLLKEFHKLTVSSLTRGREAQLAPSVCGARQLMDLLMTHAREDKVLSLR